MKKLAFIFSFFALSFAVIAQDDPKTMHQTARGFMAQADWDNAILVLNRLLQTDKNNLEYNKDMIQCYYFKRDYEKAVEGVKNCQSLMLM
jgi:lipopolysaccharide biosynthesis regulator YciM